MYVRTIVGGTGSGNEMVHVINCRGANPGPSSPLFCDDIHDILLDVIVCSV